jgi:hypothetical protein
MLPGRAMAVFTLDDFVGGGVYLLFLFGMAVPAILLPLIFGFEDFPLLLVAFPVPAEHVPPFMDAEILGDDEDPSGQDQGGHGQNHKQRAQNMHELVTLSGK